MALSKNVLDKRPVPDPTELTTDQLRRELAGLKEVLETKIEGQAAVTNERFRAVNEKFSDGKVALDAALSAQKDTANKSETGFTKQIDGVTSTVNTGLEAVKSNISDMKERVQAIESRKAGMNDFVGLIVSLAAIMLSVMLHFVR